MRLGETPRPTAAKMAAFHTGGAQLVATETATLPGGGAHGAGRGDLVGDPIRAVRETVSESPDEKAKKRIVQIVADAGSGGDHPQRTDEEDAVHPQVLQGRISGGPHRERGAGHDDRGPRHGDLQNRKLKYPDTGQRRQSDVTFASITSRRVDANLTFLGVLRAFGVKGP